MIDAGGKKDETKNIFYDSFPEDFEVGELEGKEDDELGEERSFMFSTARAPVRNSFLRRR